MKPVFWFRVPDDEGLLMSLKPAELKVFLVVLRDVQRARNTGRISSRQVADRTGLSLQHAHAALGSLVTKGLLECDKKPGATTVYTLPFSWRARPPAGEQSEPSNCSPVGEQSPPQGEQLGEQYRSPVGKQHRSPLGEQHLEYLDYSDSRADRSSDGSRAFRKASEKTPERRGAVSPNPNGLNPVGALAVVVDGTHPTAILAELKEIYLRAGLPIAPKHEQLAVQLLLNIPPEKRHRVADYVKHALLSGKWRDPTTTKNLLNLLRDGDWDVPVVERALPPAPARAQEPSRREANLAHATQLFKAQRGE